MRRAADGDVAPGLGQQVAARLHQAADVGEVASGLGDDHAAFDVPARVDQVFLDLQVHGVARQQRAAGLEVAFGHLAHVELGHQGLGFGAVGQDHLTLAPVRPPLWELCNLHEVLARG